MLNGEVRGSGATLYETVYKTGADMPVQGRFMFAYPNVFVPVLAITHRGYVMPRLQPITTADQVAGALQRLNDLWQTGKKNYVFSNLEKRRKYHEYVLDKKCDVYLLAMADLWYQRTKDIAGRHVNVLHGDCTIENAMMLADNKPVWIDPCIRTNKPMEMELDCAKMFQSLYGYDEIPEGAGTVIIEFIKMLEVSLPLVHYYLATHLVRLWPHQPQKQEWVLRVAKEIL